MESNSFEILQKQIENNITDWYPFEENVKYTIFKNFSKENIEEFEDKTKALLNNEKILIIMENGLSMKRICQNVEKQSKLLNRSEIEELLDRNNLIYRKFYYLLPDSKMTNVIFTDNHLPDAETLSRNIIFYKQNSIKKNDEIHEFKKIINQDPNLFKIFANSFFIECSKNIFEDNGIEFVSFSNMRKEEYRIKTTIKGDSVYKQAVNDKASEHIKQVKRNIDIINEIKLNTLDKYEGDTIISNYQKNKKTFDKIIINKIKNNELEDVKQLVNNLFEELKEKLIVVYPENNVFDKYEIEYEKQDIQNLTFVKYGLWDLIFQNIFYIDDKYFFFDQEWFEENLPVEFIIYRSFVYNKELQENIDIKELYKKFNITDKNIEIFTKLDNKLQQKTRSELSWKLHTELFDITNEQRFIKILENNNKQTTQEFKRLLNEKDARIRFLEDNMEQTCNLLRQKEQELEYMKYSVSWKITKPLRKIRGAIKKG